MFYSFITYKSFVSYFTTIKIYSGKEKLKYFTQKLKYINSLRISCNAFISPYIFIFHIKILFCIIILYKHQCVYTCTHPLHPHIKDTEINSGYGSLVVCAIAERHRV